MSAPAQDLLKPKPMPPDPGREFVAGGSQAAVGLLITQALNRAIDDVERDFGTDTYEKMMRDPAVYGAVETLKVLALSQPMRVVPGITDDNDPDYEQAEQLAEFIRENIEGCEDSTTLVNHEILDALWRGSYVCEKVLKAEGGKLMLAHLKPKHPNRTAYIVDQFYNILGIGLKDYTIDTLVDLPNLQGMPVVDRSRFLILKFWGVGGDPRGASLLRPAYNAWYVRQQTWPAYLKYLIQWATPSIIGTTPEGATAAPDLDADGALQYVDGDVITKTPEEAMLDGLLMFQGGSALALKGGSLVTLIQSTGDGKAFIEAMDLFKREIVLAILRVTRATMESQHGSKADSETAQDVLSVFVAWIRRVIEEAWNRDVVKWLIDLNFPNVPRKLLPQISFNAVDQQDVVALGDMIAKLWSADFIDDSQVPEIDELLRLPERDVAAWLAKRQDQADMARMATAEMGRLHNPTTGDPSADPAADGEA